MKWKRTLFYKKAEMLKIWKFSNFLPLSPRKCCYWNVFFPIRNNFSEQNCLDKPVFNSARRINHSFSMNNTVTNKIRHFLQLFAFGPPIFLERPLLALNIDAITYNQGQNLWKNVKKSSKNTKVLFLEGRLGLRLCHYFLISDDLKS